MTKERVASIALITLIVLGIGYVILSIGLGVIYGHAMTVDMLMLASMFAALEYGLGCMRQLLVSILSAILPKKFVESI